MNIILTTNRSREQWLWKTRMYSEELTDYIKKRIPVSAEYTKRQLIDDVNREFNLDFNIRRFNDFCRYRGIKTGSSPLKRVYPVEMEAFIRERIPLKSRAEKTELIKAVEERFGLTIKRHNFTDYCHDHGIKLGLIKVRKREVGSEFMNGGIVYVVMPDKSRKNKAVLLWEREHGSIKADERIIFLDGNKRNFNMDNLFLVTVKELGHLSRSKQLTSDPVQTKINILYLRQRSKLKDIGKKLGLVTKDNHFIEEVRASQQKYADSHRKERRESSRRYLQRMREQNPSKYKEWIKKCNSYKKSKL